MFKCLKRVGDDRARDGRTCPRLRTLPSSSRIVQGVSSTPENSDAGERPSPNPLVSSNANLINGFDVVDVQISKVGENGRAVMEERVRDNTAVIAS